MKMKKIFSHNLGGREAAIFALGNGKFALYLDGALVVAGSAELVKSVFNATINRRAKK